MPKTARPSDRVGKTATTVVETGADGAKKAGVKKRRHAKPDRRGDINYTYYIKRLGFLNDAPSIRYTKAGSKTLNDILNYLIKQHFRDAYDLLMTTELKRVNTATVSISKELRLPNEDACRSHADYIVPHFQTWKQIQDARLELSARKKDAVSD
jgi:hypothetical protein